MLAGRLILRIISSHCLLYHNENGSVYKTNCHATAIKYSSSCGDVHHVSRKEHPIYRSYNRKATPSLCLLSTWLVHHVKSRENLFPLLTNLNSLSLSLSPPLFLPQIKSNPLFPYSCNSSKSWSKTRLRPASSLSSVLRKRGVERKERRNEIENTFSIFSRLESVHRGRNVTFQIIPSPEAS